MALAEQPAIEQPESETLVAPTGSPADCKADPARIQEELRQSLEALAAANRQVSDANDKLNAVNCSIGLLEEQRSELETAVGALNRIKDEYVSINNEILASEARLQAMQAQENSCRERELRIEQKEAELKMAWERTQHAAEFLDKLWPDWLCCDSMKDWKSTIEKEVYSSSAAPSFQLLFAAVHNYRAAQKDPDGRILLDAIRDLGRRLYQWLRDLDKSEETMAEIAETWASAINSECGERGSVQVAIPGNPANNKWMNFTPKAGSSPDVATVRSWCVSDSQGRPIHRAEIAV
jgi:DNA repair exonuclease SbcCD ATPase subunit